jgi:hypothetical protein
MKRNLQLYVVVLLILVGVATIGHHLDANLRRSYRLPTDMRLVDSVKLTQPPDWASPATRLGMPERRVSAASR